MRRSPKRIYLAGHNGMVGRSIARRIMQDYAVSEGSELVVIERSRLDLTDSSKVMSFMQKTRPDTLIIAAAVVGGIRANESDPVRFLLDNVRITLNLVEAAWKTGCKEIINLGSSCIYPKDIGRRIKEADLLSGYLESTNEAYALAKICGLKFVDYLKSLHGVNAISLMPCNLYGPYDNFDTESSHVMAAMIKRFVDAKHSGETVVECWGSGKPRREFLHVDDLTDAVMFCLENWSTVCAQSTSWINVGAGTDISISDLARVVADKAGYNGIITWNTQAPDGVMQKLMDTSILDSLGWKPRISLDSGLQEAIEFYKSSKNSKIKD